MRKTISPRRSRRKLPWKILLAALVVVVVVAGIVLAVVYYHHRHVNSSDRPEGVRSTNSVNYSPPNPADNNPNENRKSSPAPSTTLNNGSSTPSGQTSNSFTAHIVNAQVSSDKSNVHVGTLVSGVTSGDCTLTASQAGQQDVVKMAPVQQDVNNYDCGVFNIPTSDFPAHGTWKLTLSVTNDGATASDTATVSF